MDSHSEPHEKVYRTKMSILVKNFLGGMSWAFGATIGFAIIIAVLSFLLKNINVVPYVGNFISDVIKEIIASNPQWVK